MPHRNCQSLLVDYARYHRDPRNIVTHFVGIPLIVLAIGVLLSRPALAGPASVVAWLTPAWLAWAAAALWNLSRGHLGLGLATTVAEGLLVGGGQALALAQPGSWLAWGLGLFALGWGCQFLGHYYEGRKPAFVDDLIGLLVGPMFVVAEALMALGLLARLRSAIEAGAGPTRLRDLAAPAS